MITINATLFLQVFHFLVLLFILDRLMFRPILRLVRERAQRFEALKSDIQQFEADTARLLDEFQAKEEAVRKAASAERSQLRRLGRAEIEKIMEDSRDKVVAIRNEADATAKRELKNARPLVRQQAETLVDFMMERMLGRRSSV